MTDTTDLLKKLTEAHGCSGGEYEVRTIVRSELGESAFTDRYGNLILRSVGDAESPVLMLTAHMDEVGFMVQAISERGYVKFVPLGGWWEHTLLSQRVRVRTRGGREVVGVISSKPPHFLDENERKKLLTSDKMHIDIGADSADDVRTRLGIEVGDTIVPDSSFSVMNNAKLALGKAFDNRVGLALAVQATQKFLSCPHPNTLVTVGTVQEEIGVRGARPAVQTANPDAAIILEGAPADDLPELNREESQAVLGKGVQIRLRDATAMLSRSFSDFAIRVAEECNIPYQIAVRRGGGTDARMIQVHGGGVPSIVLAVPARYIHSPNSIINLDDYHHALALVTEIVRRLDHEQFENLVAF